MLITYCYSTEEKTYDWLARPGCIPQALLVNGRIARRDIRAEHCGQQSGDPWANHSSLALMVHPLDVKKYRADAHRKRLNVTIRNDGMVEFRSRNDQKRYCQAYGYTNYGDCW
ncbi:MAG: hypothetical protein V3V96_14425 [Acidiferrobacterales bacterium]